MDWRIEDALRQHDYLISMAMLTYTQIEGMKAENKQREAQGKSIAYTYEDFEKVAIENGMNHNDSIERHIR